MKSPLDERETQSESFLLALDAASRYAEIRAQTHEVLGHRLRSRLARRDGARIRRLIAQQGLDEVVARGNEVVADPGAVHDVAMDDAELPGLKELLVGQGEPPGVPEGGGAGRGDREASGLELATATLAPVVVVESEIALSSSSQAGDADVSGIEQSQDEDSVLVEVSDGLATSAGDADHLQVMEDGELDLGAGQSVSAVEGLRAEDQWLVDQLGAAHFLLEGDDPGYERDLGADAVLEAEGRESLRVEPLTLDSLSYESDALDASGVEELFLPDEVGASAAQLEGGDPDRFIDEDGGIDLDGELVDPPGFVPGAVEPPTSPPRALDGPAVDDVFVLGEVDVSSSPLGSGDSGSGVQEGNAVDPEAELFDPLASGRVVELSSSEPVALDEPVTERSVAADSPLLAEVGASSLPLEGGDFGGDVDKGRGVELEAEGSGPVVTGPGAVESPLSEPVVLDGPVGEGSAADSLLLADGDGSSSRVERDDSGRDVEERGALQFQARGSGPLHAGAEGYESLAPAPDTLDDPAVEDARGPDEIGASPSSLEGDHLGRRARWGVGREPEPDVSESLVGGR